jgi:hypothetical protein
MAERSNDPLAKLTLEISPDTLRKIIADGRLMEFAATAATQAAAQISSQIVEGVAQAAIKSDGLKSGVSVNVAYIFEDGDFGTRPPIPKWGIGRLADMRGGGLLSRLAVAAPASDVG